jgi:hypothetical protein
MTKIEQVARAISETRDLCWDQYSPELKATYKAMARAAIAAMPIDRMIEVLVNRAVGGYKWNARADELRDELLALKEDLK